MTRIILTEDGSHTIYVPELNEHYHSVHGAIQESMHVFIKSGMDSCTSNPLNILEIGFGTGLNALLTAINNRDAERHINYTAIEKYPLQEKEFSILNYPDFYGKEAKEIFRRIHLSDWGSMEKICPGFFMKKLNSDVIHDSIEGSYNLIYFDAFAPDKQPGMWNYDVFRKISAVSASGATFVTYSAKGDVKRNLRSCGFKVVILPGPPGKRHIIRAVKD